MRLISWLRTKLSNAGNLFAVIGLAKEFAALVAAKNYKGAEDKVIEILKLFIPEQQAGALDKFLDAIIGAIESGVELWPMIMQLIGVQNLGPAPSGGPKMLNVGHADIDADVAASAGMLDGVLTMVQGTEEQKTENPLVIIALGGLLLQAIEFIIKRRRERKQNP